MEDMCSRTANTKECKSKQYLIHSATFCFKKKQKTQKYKRDEESDPIVSITAGEEHFTSAFEIWKNSSVSPSASAKHLLPPLHLFSFLFAPLLPEDRALLFNKWCSAKTLIKKQWTDSAPNMPQWHKQWLRDTVSEEGHSKQNKPPLVCLEAVMTLHLFVCMCVRAHVYCSRRNHKGSFDFSSCICLSVWRWMCVTDTVSLRYKHWQVSTKCMSLKRDLVWGKRGSKEVGKSWGL